MHPTSRPLAVVVATAALAVSGAGWAAPLPRTSEGDATVGALVRAVSGDSVDLSVADLEGFGTRRADLAEGRRAATWLAARFRSFGVDSVYVQNWNRGYAPNVVAVRRGTTRPGEIVLVGGHFDSVSYQGVEAPGADDNASGTACVLECARVLCGARFERTLQFAGFSAEEFGLFGSNAYAAHLATSGDTVVAMLNVDMIGYLAPGDRRDLDIISGGANGWLRDAVFQAAALHVPDLRLVDGSYQGGATSDHATFWARGMPAIAFFEDVDSPSPFIHTPNDLFGLSYNDPVLALQSTRTAVALLATLGLPVPVPVLVQDLRARLDGERVVLAWRLSGDGWSAVAGVRVQRAAEVLGPYADRTQGSLVPAPAMVFTDGDLEAGAMYWYRLAILGARGEIDIAGPVAVRMDGTATQLLAAHEPAGGGPVAIRWSLGPAGQPARLAVYDARGRRVRLLESGERAPGSYLSTWDRRDEAGGRAARGVYLLHLEAGSARVARKLVLLHD